MNSWTAVAVGQQLGDTVVVTSQAAPLRVQSTLCGSVPQGELLEVEDIDRDLFWVVWSSNNGTVMGWISRSDVAPLSHAVNFVNAMLKRNATARAYAIRGAIRYEQDAYEQAIADYTEAIRLDPKVARVWSSRGWTWGHKSEFAKAAADFQQGISLDPNDSRTLIERGLTSYSAGKIDEAIADFDRAVTLDPRSPEAYAARGTIRLAQNSFEAAIVDVDRAIALDHRFSSAYKSRGAIHL